jgi:hypothetical protein
MHDKASAPASHRRSRWASVAAVGASMLRDRRGAASLTQTIILLSAVALLAFAGYQALGAATSESARCAGDAVEALSPVQCKDGEAQPSSVAQPSPPPEAPRADGGDSDAPEIDLKKELLDLFLDITGLNDIKDCVLKGDPLACVMAIASASPIKGIAIGVKLAKNAKRIQNLIDRLIAAGKARKAEEKAREAEEKRRKAEEAREKVARNECKPGTPECPCFVAGTPVHTASGWVPIEELQVGDLVLSRDEDTGEEALRPIAAVFITPDSPVLALELEDSMGALETIEATPPHPFFVEDRGWIPASDLRPGDQITSSGGGLLRVASTTEILRNATVYNFEVQDFHTYFVGQSAAWVHNDYPDKKKPTRDPAKKRQEVIECLKDFLRSDPQFKALKQQFPDARFGFTGSVATGTVGNPNKKRFGEPFDPFDFDLDLFIVDEDMPQPTKQDEDGRRRPKPINMQGLRSRLKGHCPEALIGLKPDGTSVVVRRPNEVPGDTIWLD